MADLQWDRGFALEQAGDDEELLAELLALLRQSSADDLARMKQALAAGDGQALANAAHNTKGAAASLGMARLRGLASEVEQAGRQEKLTEIPSLLAALEEMIGQLSAVE